MTNTSIHVAHRKYENFTWAPYGFNNDPQNDKHLHTRCISEVWEFYMSTLRIQQCFAKTSILKFRKRFDRKYDKYPHISSTQEVWEFYISTLWIPQCSAKTSISDRIKMMASCRSHIKRLAVEYFKKLSINYVFAQPWKSIWSRLIDLNQLMLKRSSVNKLIKVDAVWQHWRHQYNLLTVYLKYNGRLFVCTGRLKHAS